MNLQTRALALAKRFKESLLIGHRDGRLPYALLFVALITAVLLGYAIVETDLLTRMLFLSMALLILLLSALVIIGMSLPLAVHLGTAGGAALLTVLSLMDGGVTSPRMAWLLILPVTPMYVAGRRAGLGWFVAVALLQAGIGLCTYRGWLFEVHETSSALETMISYGVLTAVLSLMPMIYHRMHSDALRRGRADQLQLEGKRRELEHALQVREHFIATVSHELRTPMNAILGFNALLLSRAHDRPEAHKVLMHTHRSADHLMTVINDILDYSQLQAGRLVVNPEVFDLREALAHAHELLLPRVRGTDLEYRLELDPDLPQWVRSDRHRLTQVLVNLLGNALKFTHRGSVVLRAQWENPGVRFSVQDTGIGIPKATHDRIFKRFSQADAAIQAQYGGNGLGLSISRQLVELLGGSIGFESEPGHGSLFWFRLPLQAWQPPHRRLVQAGGQLTMKTAATPWRFLVVDDHFVNRQLVKSVLQQAWPQAEIAEAADGQQALDELSRGAVDLVLMDMVMPVMDGIEATRRIRAQTAWVHLPVLGLTANVSPVDLEAFKAAGLTDLMLKPFEPARLCNRVEQILLLLHH